VTRPVLDAALLRKHLERLTDQPSRHRQHGWFLVAAAPPAPPMTREQAQQVAAANGCGTFACLAGDVVAEAGEQLRLRPSAATLTVTDDGRASVWIAECTESGGSIGSAARRILGLTIPQATALFDGSNSLADLWLLAEAMSGGDIVCPAELRAAGRNWNPERAAAVFGRP
jgi:hypothetical protein